MLRKAIIRSILFVMIIIGSVEAFRWGDSQFRLGNIGYDPEFFGVEATSKLSPEVIKILQQPFIYLDRGKQSFAFVSEDGGYVLKFFDLSRLRLWSDKDKAAQRIHQAVHGYAIADAYDRDHVGLLYLQLQPRGEGLPKITLTDRFGITHVVDLNEVPFILQKKAVQTRKFLKTAKDVPASLQQIYDMYADEHARGVYDSDHNVMVNTGFADGQPMRIDAGRLKIDNAMKDPSRSLQEINKIKRERVTIQVFTR